MRKYLYSFIALGALLCTSCSTEMQEEAISSVTKEIPQSIVVNFESDTRVHLEGGKTTPTVGDLFYVFNKINHCDTYIYNGNTNEDGKAIIEFRDTTGYTQHTAMDKLVIIYNESQPELYVNNGSPTTATVVVKSSQKYTKDSYAISAAPMVSVSDDNGSVMFKNICGWVKLSLTGNGETIKKIEFSGNNNEGLAFGSNPPTKIDVNDLSVYSVGHPFKKLTMTFDNDNKEDNWDTATLSSTPTDFYFSMPPVEFTNGFNVKITCTDGTVMTKSTSKKIKINRNEIQAMEPFAYAGEQIELDFSNMSIAQFNDLTYTQGYANTFEVKLANGNEIGNSFFIFYNPDYQPSGEGDAGTLNGEYEIVVTEIGTKSFDKKVFIADASYCYFTDDGSTYYFKSGTVTVSGNNASTTMVFDAIVTNSEGGELPLKSQCILTNMCYTTKESVELPQSFIYQASGGYFTMQSTSGQKTMTIELKTTATKPELLSGKTFTDTAITDCISSGSIPRDEVSSYDKLVGSISFSLENFKHTMTTKGLKFVDVAGNIYQIKDGSYNVNFKPGTINSGAGGLL
ncbi:MAG: hypothetical protein IIX42_01405 [Alistipes sp.]|nr:hypothetical protein [Alistipes sp.]